MRKIIALLLVFCMLPTLAAADEFQPLPEAFNVAYTIENYLINKDKSYVIKEYVTTAQPAVDETLRAIVDAYEEQYAPTLPAYDTPKRNSRLDVSVVHSVTGQSLVSFQVIARTIVRRNPQNVDFVCHTYDMETGAEITLADLFPADSAAWDLIANAVRETLDAYFPQYETDAAALDALCTREAIESAQFTLSPVALYLHYYSSELYEGHTTLMHVSIPYVSLQGMMTEYGAKQTDNSMYKVVAITYDDGPSYTTTNALLTVLRQFGVRATFFIVGNRIEEYKDVVMRENDENHSLQSHNYKHVNAEDIPAYRLLEYVDEFNTALSSVTGSLPVVMRAPYGTWQPLVKAGVNYPQISWDVDTKDWAGRSAKNILKTVQELTLNGSIILMHDITDDIDDATILVLDWLRQEGYLCLTVEELFIHMGVEMQSGVRYYNAIIEE